MSIDKPRADKHLALISVILGAASLFNTIFTGIPAIVLGILALKRKTDNPTQAKVGIVLGMLGSLLVIPLVWLAFHFLRGPIGQQTAVSRQDYQKIQRIATALRAYKHEHGTYPQCSPAAGESTCAEWQHFIDENPGLVSYPVQFAGESTLIQDRPAGTLVYANRTSCFLSIPTAPGWLDEDAKYHLDSYAALVYFHDKGRACYDVNERR